MSIPETPAMRALRLALAVISCAALAAIPAAILAGALTTCGPIGLSAGAWMASAITAACALVPQEGRRPRPRAPRHPLGQ